MLAAAGRWLHQLAGCGQQLVAANWSRERPGRGFSRAPYLGPCASRALVRVGRLCTCRPASANVRPLEPSGHHRRASVRLGRFKWPRAGSFPLGCARTCENPPAVFAGLARAHLSIWPVGVSDRSAPVIAHLSAPPSFSSPSIHPVGRWSRPKALERARPFPGRAPAKQKPERETSFSHARERVN